MSSIQKAILAGLALLIFIGISLLVYDASNDSGRRDRKMSQNLENLRQIRKQKPKDPNKDYFQRKEELMWGGGKSGGREREPPKTPFDDLLGN
ncbi:hypothetical protein [Helicobacter sp. T3_23-1056]